MNPATVAAICVSLALGMTRAEIMAAAVKNAIEAYRAKHGREAQ